MKTRREFMKDTIKVLGGLALPLTAFKILEPEKLLAAIASGDKSGVRWVFLVDAYKCIGCGFCVKACKLENETPYDANVMRTWVERYVLLKNGRLYADNPKGARDGYTTGRIELARGEYQDIRKEDIEKAYFVPKLCNQCENPPCVQVCPVGATYQTEDGVVLVDRKWCIGCGYCIMACPYGVRYFDPVNHVAEKCNYCYHRITKGMKTACVEACPVGARRIGNIKDPNDPVAKIIMSERVGVLKEEYGTKPQNYYIGLSKEVK